MLQTTSTEQRAAGGDRPRSGGSVKNASVHPVTIRKLWTEAQPHAKVRPISRRERLS